MTDDVKSRKIAKCEKWFRIHKQWRAHAWAVCWPHEDFV